VGEVEANRVSERASTRGTTLHNHAEKYLRNQPVTIPKVRFLDVSLMRGLVPSLNRISNVRILEGQLYSHTFKLAGTVDCVADFDSVKSTIDFKSSTKIKERYEIDDYFMQVSIYSYMLTERYGLNYNQLVVLIAQEFGPAQVFIDDRRNWRSKVAELINNR
jgi:genome maintenance exonuclease 1